MTHRNSYSRPGASSHRNGDDQLLPPHDARIENGCLGAVLLAGDTADEPDRVHAMIDRLTPSLFYTVAAKEVCRAVQRMRREGRAVTTLLIVAALRERGRLEEAGGLAQVAGLADCAPSAEAFEPLLDKLSDLAQRRELLRLGAEARRIAFDPTADPATAVRDFAEMAGNVVRPPAIAARPIGTLKPPAHDDGRELLRNRYLCRGAGVLLVGQSGQGKSSLSFQLAASWALGRACFGFVPALPLRVLVVQAENDDGDMFEMFDGITRGMGLTVEQRASVGESILLHAEDCASGLPFCREVVTPLVEQHKPDLLLIDPALAFVGGDSKDAVVVGAFLRQGLNPILRRYNCGLLLVHHTTKARPDGPQSTDHFLYAGCGSVEWTNWARAVLALETKGNGCYRLHAPKRGSRIGWRNAAGEPEFDRFIRHDRSPGVIYWHEVDPADVESVAKSGKSKADLMPHVPADGAVPLTVLIEKARGAGIGEKKSRAFLDELLAEGLVHLWLRPRPGTNPLKAISRHPQPPAELACL